jgi:hypothetical protein
MLGLNINTQSGPASRMRQDVASAVPDVQSSFSKVYPNPSNGNMQLDYSLTEGTPGELVIYDLTGRKINAYKLSAGEKNTLSISEEALKNGVYFYELIINNEMVNNDKIIIIK